MAKEIEPGVWHLSDRLEPTLRELGERGDIIKSINRSLAARGEARGAESILLHGEAASVPVTGRVIGKELADELGDRVGLIIDGIDGRVHHVTLGAAAMADEARIGAIVEIGRARQRRVRPIAISPSSPAEPANTARAITGLSPRRAECASPVGTMTPMSRATSAGWRHYAAPALSSGSMPTAG